MSDEGGVLDTGRQMEWRRIHASLIVPLDAGCGCGVNQDLGQLAPPLFCLSARNWPGVVHRIPANDSPGIRIARN